MKRSILTVIVCVGYLGVASSDVPFTQDTYALQNSEKPALDANGGAYQYSQPPNYNYLPLDTPGSYQYNPPPNNNYLPPSAPSPVNGPLSGFYKPVYPVPYHTHDSWFWDKLKSKISLFTIGKLVLKLLIFKKIVKFIGIICLLLVLPKLKTLFHDSGSMSSEEEGLSSKHVETDKEKMEKHINDIHEFIVSAIQEFDER
ncbi:uncharacterized protein LOC108604796 [Drosophila busckii]|uniref:uncharacterized protein LOC108604796 n=1 Tax=Drosophila busckii TaxID=30019 RepID=UPI00083F24F9|nr:uncharacterized protein LOC108604796 [Drosophila busckii]